MCVSFDPLTIALPGNFVVLSKGDSQKVTYEACGITAKAVFRGNFIGLNPYIRKEEKLKSSNVILGGFSVQQPGLKALF